MTISERILKVLKERKMTQAEFAKRVGISPSTICEWKKRKMNPSADRVSSGAKKVAELTNIDLKKFDLLDEVRKSVLMVIIFVMIAWSKRVIIARK